MGKITIQSIAKELGLSRNTVSLAIKGSELVKPRTREMVLKYAKSVGYLASEGESLAEEIKQAEDGRVEPYQIMILRKPDVAVYWDKVINGISEEGSNNNCQTQVAVVTDEDEEKLLLPPGLDERINAVFCIKFMRLEYIQKIKNMGIHIFTLDNYKTWGTEALGDMIKSEGFNKVVTLTNHLIEQGITRIGYLSESSGLYETMYDRYEGYKYAISRAGLNPHPSIVLPDATSDAFYSAGTFEKIVDSYEEIPEAVVCGNDEIAKYLTLALRKKGYRVPEDVAITGFDNDEENMLDPFFTTIYVDAKWLGRRMVQCFLWRMKNPEAPYEKIVVEGKVIIRKSSCWGKSNLTEERIANE